jgi:uncharacterized damage-inducible protein DinB
MASALRDVFGHNAWANQRLIAFLSELTAEHLQATDGAVYGNPIVTMHHVLDGEAGYWHFFSGHRAPGVRYENEPATLLELAQWASEMASHWQAVAVDEIDAGAWLERKSSDGRVIRLKSGILVAQTIHHGNVHREQVSHVLTALGIEAPDLSLYAYAREAGA